MSGINENVQGKGNSSAPPIYSSSSNIASSSLQQKKISNAFENPQRINESLARKPSGLGPGVGSKIGGNPVSSQEGRGGAAPLDSQPIRKQGGKPTMVIRKF